MLTNLEYQKLHILDCGFLILDFQLWTLNFEFDNVGRFQIIKKGKFREQNG